MATSKAATCRTRKAAVWRTRDGGDSWEALREGLPQRNVFFGVLRQAMATDRLEPAGIYFGTNTGALFASADEGDSWTLHRAAPAPDLLGRDAGRRGVAWRKAVGDARRPICPEPAGGRSRAAGRGHAAGGPRAAVPGCAAARRAAGCDRGRDDRRAGRPLAGDARSPVRFPARAAAPHQRLRRGPARDPGDAPCARRRGRRCSRRSAAADARPH